jgi:hypothetical protein
MDMEVENFLPGKPIAINNKPIAFLRDSMFIGELLCEQEHLANKLGVPFFKIREGRYVLLWCNQHVDRGLRINVFKSKQLLVLVDFVSRNVASNDFAENAIFAHLFIPPE